MSSHRISFMFYLLRGGMIKLSLGCLVCFVIVLTKLYSTDLRWSFIPHFSTSAPVQGFPLSPGETDVEKHLQLLPFPLCTYPDYSPRKKDEFLWQTGWKTLACWPQPHGGAYPGLLLLQRGKFPGQPSLQDESCVVLSPRTGKKVGHWGWSLGMILHELVTDHYLLCWMFPLDPNLGGKEGC